MKTKSEVLRAIIDECIDRLANYSDYYLDKKCDLHMEIDSVMDSILHRGKDTFVNTPYVPDESKPTRIYMKEDQHNSVIRQRLNTKDVL